MARNLIIVACVFGFGAAALADSNVGEPRKFAWAENLGWINFGPHAGDARWDAAAFRARGYVWSENAGWINLDDGVWEICSIPGDGNGDGVVNASDFAVLAGNYGSAGNPRFRNGDATGDGVVNASDFTVLAGNFGLSCP